MKYGYKKVNLHSPLPNAFTFVLNCFQNNLCDLLFIRNKMILFSLKNSEVGIIYLNIAMLPLFCYKLTRKGCYTLILIEVFLDSLYSGTGLDSGIRLDFLPVKEMASCPSQHLD